MNLSGLGVDQPRSLLLGEGEAHHGLVARERQVHDPPDAELDPVTDHHLVGPGQRGGNTPHIVDGDHFGDATPPGRVIYGSVARQSDDETDRASDWGPGRTHWWTTTAIAIIGAIVGGTSLIMNFFYHPSPPPITIDSGHSEFMKLSYADRVDRCVPHISQNLHAWQDRWRSALDQSGGSHQKAPAPFAALDDAGATGQGIVNTYLAVVNYAEKLAPTDEGENLFVVRVRPRAEDGSERQLSRRRVPRRKRQ